LEDSKILEKKTLFVVLITLLTMFLEIYFGYITHSMALLADGLHMGTHSLALSLTFLAYFFSRKLINSELFPNGTGKIKTLAAYTSSLFLGLTGIWIVIESVLKLIKPVQILFSEAIIIAVIGLFVNIFSITIMNNKHEHKHHEDYNFKSAYLHILADILTSVLAIFALLIGKFLHFTLFDPIIGIVGGIIILKWSKELIIDTSKILLDMAKNF